MELKKGQEVKIHGYKHDGKPHRAWDVGIVLENDDEKMVVINNNTLVTESDGRTWYTKEPAICFFYKHRWFNVICMLRKTGIYYYCNIASPAIYDGEAIKYIDYDLDLKVFPDNSMKVLDEGEYHSHKIELNYPQEIDEIVHSQLAKLKEMVFFEEGAFNRNQVLNYYDRYKDIVQWNYLKR